MFCGACLVLLIFLTSSSLRRLNSTANQSTLWLFCLLSILHDVSAGAVTALTAIAAGKTLRNPVFTGIQLLIGSVSYTHLTLPTNSGKTLRNPVFTGIQLLIGLMFIYASLFFKTGKKFFC